MIISQLPGAFGGLRSAVGATERGRTRRPSGALATIS